MSPLIKKGNMAKTELSYTHENDRGLFLGLFIAVGPGVTRASDHPVLLPS